MQLAIQTSRLNLLPFTQKICEETLNNAGIALGNLGITPGNGWPDADTLDTLPRIINNLNQVQEPSGFESWMIVKRDTNRIIGDIGFKGIPNEMGEIDLGYGVIASERKKGIALEAAAGLLDWAFSQDKVKAITASCNHDNLGSQRILTLLNFSQIRKDDHLIYWKLFKDSYLHLTMQSISSSL